MPQYAAMIAEAFATRLAGRLDPQIIQHNVQTLLRANTSYLTEGDATSVVFYIRIELTVNPRQPIMPTAKFVGNAGGLSIPGYSFLAGNLFTEDLRALIRDTLSFEFNATPVYLSVLFFDGSSRLLGHFESGAAGTVTGVGGGTGSWTPLLPPLSPG